MPTLYKSCLRQIAVNMSDGVYKLCPQNLFSLMPSKIVNDIMSAAIKHQPENHFRAADLEQVLTSGKLQELKISYIGSNLNRVFQAISQVISFLKSGCQKLEILHLPYFEPPFWEDLEKSVSSTRLRPLLSEISEAIVELLANTPNLKDFHCGITFDLKALRNCRALRRLGLHFHPQQPWYDFLEEEEGHFQTHKCLEIFTVCYYQISTRNVDYIVIILRHCPELISMRFVESSMALSQLHRMGISSSELKLRHCYWDESRDGCAENHSQMPDDSRHLIREAAQNYPTIEELHFHWCDLRSIPCLTNLKNLIYLNFTFANDISDGAGKAFNDALQVIGPQLKHLCFNTACPMDVSLLLQNCRNLESLKIKGNVFKRKEESGFTEFVNSSVSLPNLQRLAFNYIDHPDDKRGLRLFCDCNQLTELFFYHVQCLDDLTVRHFLQRNSLSNLKVALLLKCAVTDDGFRELLQNAPQMENARICRHIQMICDPPKFPRVVSKNSEDSPHETDEFFMKRWGHGYLY